MKSFIALVGTTYLPRFIGRLFELR